jgi:hypothetical protein
VARRYPRKDAAFEISNVFESQTFQFSKRFEAALAAAAHHYHWRVANNLSNALFELAQGDELRTFDVIFSVLNGFAHIHQATAGGKKGF